MKPEQMSRPKLIRSFVVSFLMPTLIGKSFVLYFGLNYSSYPGEGYGYGLVASIAFTVFMLLRFVWRFRNVGDI
jgi:hypothetical protein